MPWPVHEPWLWCSGVSRVLPHKTEVKLVGVWFRDNLLLVYFQSRAYNVHLFIPIFVQTAFCSTTDAWLSSCSLIRSHFVSLWRACCFPVVTHTPSLCCHTGAKTQKHRLPYEHGAGRHVDNLTCARSVLCPFLVAWESLSVRFHTLVESLFTTHIYNRHDSIK